MERGARSPVAQFVRGFFSPLRAAQLLAHQRGLRRYAVLPFLANVLAFILLFAILLAAFSALNVSAWAPDWLGWFGEWFLRIVKWGVLLALYVVVLVFGFTPIGLVLVSPINDLLSERVEHVVCGRGGEPELPWRMWLKITLYSLRDSASVALRQILFTILTLPFLLIPVVGPVPLLVVGAYYEGMGFYDVPLARHLLRPAHRRVGLKGRWWERLGLGAAMVLLLAIPGAGLFALPLGVTAATILYTEIDWVGRLRAAGLAPPPGFMAPEQPSAA